MIKIYSENNNILERSYIIDVIFHEFLGLEYECLHSDNTDYHIVLPNGKKIIVEDKFFKIFHDDKEYLSFNNIPQSIQIGSNQFILEDDVVIIYGSNKIEVLEDKIVCGLDIFASSFFMITRWEEFVNKKRDKHDRFPASESIAYKHNFLHRPIVNEYVDMLWNMIHYFDSTLSRKKRKFNIIPTHDVDFPFLYLYKSPYHLIKRMIGDIAKRKDISSAISAPFKWMKVRNGEHSEDPYNTFSWFMDTDEKFNLKSEYYFICGNTCEKDADYDIRDLPISKLLLEISNRGHSIGLHASYNAYNNGVYIGGEIEALKRACYENKIDLKYLLNRQHFLRWDVSTTPDLLNKNKVNYDSTLYYAQEAGFRCGVCYMFPLFDIINRKKLVVKERPLIIMDKTLFDKKYNNLNCVDAVEKINQLKNQCAKYNGDFIFLWHNNFLLEGQYKELYLHFISS